MALVSSACTSTFWERFRALPLRMKDWILLLMMFSAITPLADTPTPAPFVGEAIATAPEALTTVAVISAVESAFKLKPCPVI